MGASRPGPRCSCNGSIYLKARNRVTPPADAPEGTVTTKTGCVTFKAGSVTEVVPDAARHRTRCPTARAMRPYRGGDQCQRAGTIDQQRHRCAPPGGQHLVGRRQCRPTRAIRKGRVCTWPPAARPASPASVDRCRSWQKNLQTFRVTSNELKNSPDQKTGVLRGATVTVDLQPGQQPARTWTATATPWAAQRQPRRPPPVAR